MGDVTLIVIIIYSSVRALLAVPKENHNSLIDILAQTMTTLVNFVIKSDTNNQQHRF